MKAVAQLIPVVLSLLVLGAHFLRDGSPLLTAVTLALLGLLAVRRPWSVRVIQVVLVLGALEWIRTLVRLASYRADAGQPVLRMAIILGVVAAFTLFSAWMFRTATLRRVYGR